MLLYHEAGIAGYKLREIPYPGILGLAVKGIMRRRLTIWISKGGMGKINLPVADETVELIVAGGDPYLLMWEVNQRRNL